VVDKSMQGEELVFENGDIKETKSKSIAANPKSKKRQKSKPNKI
jgi:hypothetical protein